MISGGEEGGRDEIKICGRGLALAGVGLAHRECFVVGDESEDEAWD